MMDERRSRGDPHLESFLGSAFCQSSEDDRSLEEVVKHFRSMRWPDIAATRADIVRLLQCRHNDIETAYDSFRPSQMSDIPERYPNLDHFIGSEFLQDFDSDVTVSSAVANYARVYDIRQSRAVMDEARRFLREQHNDIEGAFYGFKPQVYPPGGGCTVSEWFQQIVQLFDNALSQQRT